MFELKKGMKVQIKEFTDIYTFKEIDVLKNEYYLYNFDNVVFKHTPDEIDWEETAKLNGTSLEHEKNKKIYIDTCIENGMTKERAIEECDLVSKPFSPKYDKNKLDWSLLPISEIEEIVKVLDYGKHKYKKNGWKNVENAKERYLSATYRHLVEYTKGNKFDEESGLSHLSHLATNVLFMMWFENNKEE